MPTNEDGVLEPQPGQEENTLELDPNLNPNPQGEGEGNGQGNDPLDEIQDLETLRAEAKKHRAIANRRSKAPVAAKPEDKKEEPAKPAVAPTGDYLKKSDFEVSNQKKAVNLITVIQPTDNDDVKAKKADIAENFDKIRSYYVPRRGKLTAEDVAKDLEDAYILFNAHRPAKVAKDDPTVQLKETKVVPAGGSAAPQKTAKPSLNIKTPTPPSQWYPKKS